MRSPAGEEPISLLIATTVPVTLEAFLLPYARRYRAAGFRVDGAADGAAGTASLRRDFDRLWDVPWKRNPLHPLNAIAAARFYRELRRGKYTIVHVHTPVAAFFGRLAAFAIGRNRPAMVYTAHGFHFVANSRRLGPRLFRALERLSARWTDVLIVLTAEDEEQALAIGYRLEGVVRIPGVGINSQFFDRSMVSPADVQEVRVGLGIPRSSALFACIAEFTANKRQGDLVEALARLDDQVHVVFAGDGPMRASVESLASKLGVAHRAHFLGFASDVRPLIVAATAVVLASAREGLPRSLLEAMSLATPIIATDVRGSRELAAVGGLMVPVGDVAALAQAMGALVGDAGRCRELGQRGRAAVLAIYDFDRVAASHDATYARALEARRIRLDPH